MLIIENRMKSISALVIFIVITASFTLACYSRSPTYYADIDTTDPAKEIISLFNSKAYIWRGDKTLLKVMDEKDLRELAVSLEGTGSEVSVSILSENGSNLFLFENGVTIEHGIFHHLKQPRIRNFLAYVDSNGDIDIRAHIDSDVAYSYLLKVCGRGSNTIKVLKSIDSTLEAEISTTWDGNLDDGELISPESYLAVLELGSDFNEKIAAAVSIEIMSASAELKDPSPSLPAISNTSVSPSIFCPGSICCFSRFSYFIANAGQGTRKSISVLSGTGQTVKTLPKNVACASGSFSEIWYGDTAVKTADRNGDGYADEGPYSFLIELADANGIITSESVEIKIISKPSLKVLSCTTAYSPDGDGIKDDLDLTYELGLSVLLENEAVVELEIYDKDNVLVHKASESRPSGIHSFTWNGMLDGTSLPDGDYLIRIIAKDSIGNFSEKASNTTAIDNTSPTLAFEGAGSIVFNPYFQPAEFTFRLGSENTSPLRTSISMFKGGRQIRQIMPDGSLDGNRTYSEKWDGRNDENLYMNEGTYYLMIILTDEAGNTVAASRDVLLEDDQKLTSGGTNPKRPYLNNWADGSGNYKLIAQANSETNKLACFYLAKRQTVKVVTYNVGGATEKKRCALFDNFRKKVIFDHNMSGTYYFDLPEGSYAALADFTRWSDIPKVIVDVYAVDPDSVTNYYGSMIKIKYYCREYLVPVAVDTTRFVVACEAGNDEDYFIVNDEQVSARIRTGAETGITSQHEIFKYGKASAVNSIFRSTSSGNDFNMTLKKGLYMSWVRASAWLLAGKASTLVDFFDRKFDEYSISSNDCGRSWSLPSMPSQSDCDYYFDNTLGYWGKTGGTVHKAEIINGQVHYIKGVILKEGAHSETQLLNNEYAFPSSITEPEISWMQGVQLTFKAKDPKDPSLCEDSEGNIYIVWKDSRSGTTEVFFQKVPYNFEPIYPGNALFISRGSIMRPVMLQGTSLEALSIFIDKAFTVSNVLNHPNPFDPTKERTFIRYQLSDNADKVDIRIYDLRGSLVRILIGNTCGQSISKYNDVQWDGRNGIGDIVRNGVYPFDVIARRNSIVIKAKGIIVVLK